MGSKACAPCHKDIYDQFVKTEMGRSMSLPDVPSQLEKVPKPVTAYDKQIGRYFEVARQGSDLYQSEYALDSAGEVLFRHTEKIAFVVGNRGEPVQLPCPAGRLPLSGTPILLFENQELGPVSGARNGL